MSSAITSESSSCLLWRFIDHARLGLYRDIQPHEETVVERLGNAPLWTIEKLPNLILEQIRRPCAITVALTAIAQIANAYAFYPERTLQMAKWAVDKVPWPPAWALRFGCYLYTSSLILGYGLRAFGRFNNPELMKQFYNTEPRNRYVPVRK